MDLLLEFLFKKIHLCVVAAAAVAPTATATATATATLTSTVQLFDCSFVMGHKRQAFALLQFSYASVPKERPRRTRLDLGPISH